MPPIPALWATKKYDSKPYNSSVTFDFYKAGMSNEYVSRAIVRVSGTINTGAGSAGTATGLDNPEGFLTNALLTTAPTQGSAGLIAFNNISGRGLRLVKAVNKQKLTAYTAVTDGGGAQTVYWEYEFIFKRNHVRKSVEYGLDLTKFTSCTLTLTFDANGSTLFSGSANTPFNFSGLTVELWADVGYNVNPDGLHAVETFEQVFPITANGDLLINQLPAGVLYSDLYIAAEHNNVQTDGIVANVDIEGGGRNWTYAGDNNAGLLRDCETLDCFDGSVVVANVAGWYFFRMRDGSFLRAIDASKSQIVLKINISGWTGSGTYNLRLIGKKMVPYGVEARKANNKGTTKVTGKQ